MSAGPSIRWNVTRVVLLTTLAALCLNALLLAFLDAHSYRKAELSELRVHADMLARASAAAVAFNDAKEANEAVRLVERNARLHAAAIYGRAGKLFAAYSRDGQPVPESTAGSSGFAFTGDQIRGFHTAVEPGGLVHTIYLSAHSRFYDRLIQYFGILTGVMLAVLGVAFLLSRWLQRSITEPILNVAHAAGRVVASHDYKVRVPPQFGPETGLLADAFNHMLSEIDRRTTELHHQVQEREQAEAALREADRKKDRFLATLAHELRNPLAPIMTSVQLMRRVTGSDVVQQRAQDVIDRQARHMSRLLDDLLDVARITNEKLQLQRRRVTLASVIEAAVESSRPAVERGGHHLSVRLPDAPILLEGDPVRLAQIFTNLLNNAAKYMNPGGTINVNADLSEGTLAVRVEDTGIGIAGVELGKIFEILGQSGTALRHADGGLGIGLFLVKALTELHGGHVVASSDGPGRGSCFTVRLPIAEVEEQAQGADAHADTQRWLSNRKILVVDDNRDAADMLAAALRLDRNSVRTAYCGLDAVEATGEFRPDVVFVDIGLPDIDGYEVARRIRSTGRDQDLVLVAITGWGTREDKERARLAGFDHHLTKPAALEDVERLFRQHQSRAGRVEDQG